MIKKIIKYLKEKRASAQRVKNPSFEGVQILFEYDPARLLHRLNYGLLKQTKKYKIPSFTLSYRNALSIEEAYEDKDYLKIAKVADLSVSKESDYFYVIALVNAVVSAYNEAVDLSFINKNNVKETKENENKEDDEQAKSARINRLKRHEKNLLYLVNKSPFEHEFLMNLELKEAIKKIKMLNDINKEENAEQKQRMIR